MRSESRLVQAADAALSRPRPYDGASPSAETWQDEDQVRALLFSEGLQATRSAAIIRVAVAAALLAFFWSSPQWLFATGLLVFAATSALGVGIACRLDVCRKASPRGVRLGLHATVALAAATGLVWAMMPILLFPPSSPDQRMVVLAGVAVVLGSVATLGRIQRASVVYAIPLCVGSMLGFALGQTPAALALAASMPIYASLLLWHCARLNAAAARQTADRITVAEQTHTIRDLLLNFDETASDWLWQTDASGCFANVSDDVANAVALPVATVEGARFETIFARLESASATNGPRAILTAVAARKPFRDLLVEIEGNDQSRWWRLSGKPFYDEAGRFFGYRGVGSDMTGAHNSESRIAHLANYDALTGFANRANFQIFSGHQCAAAAQDGRCRALICLDLDSFKSVNDSLGHEGGDELLRQVAARLIATAPTGTFIARTGGDEFSLWLQPTTPSKAETAARTLLEVLNVAFDINGLQVEIGATAGVVFTPKHTADPDDLLVKANLALYRAKAENKGKVCVFSPTFETRLIERRKLEGDLKLALARGEFVLHYQPIVDVSLGRVVRFEALIRWQSPDRGMVSPADFIPLAETSGLIVPVGRWVLFEACRAAAAWPREIHVAVNVSPPHVRSSEFLQDVMMALKMSGLHPSRLEIEVTEGVLLDKSFAALETLRTLQTRGVRIALDDFGTGYSSFNYLVDFPVDKIKIDRSFISNFAESHANQAIVDAMLGLARKLSIKVTAEGVETKEQALALKHRRCDEFQGYLFSRPRPEAAVSEMIAAVPALFRAAIPIYMDSPLALALAARKRLAG